MKSQPKEDGHQIEKIGLSEEQICSIEEAIAFKLPHDVRAVYLESDGMLGPTDCYLLYPFRESRGFQIAAANEIQKEDWFPTNLKSLAILGDDGCGNLICYDTASNEAVLWNPGDGDWVQERRPTVAELWDLVSELYDECERDSHQPS